MRTFIQSLSDRTEFIVVVTVAFGYLIYVSVASVFYPVTGPSITDSDFYLLLAQELLVMALLFPFLAVRGWNLQRIGLKPDLKDSLIGVALTIAAYAGYFAFLAVALEFYPQPEAGTSAGVFDGLRISLVTVVAISIINPVFEEVFVCGYVMTALKKRAGIWVAINASVLIRLLYHLYQGPVGVISIIPIGIIFAYWYARTGRLWPLIVAHALLDFFGLIVHSDL